MSGEKTLDKTCDPSRDLDKVRRVYKRGGISLGLADTKCSFSGFGGSPGLPDTENPGRRCFSEIPIALSSADSDRTNRVKAIQIQHLINTPAISESQKNIADSLFEKLVMKQR